MKNVASTGYIDALARVYRVDLASKGGCRGCFVRAWPTRPTIQQYWCWATPRDAETCVCSKDFWFITPSKLYPRSGDKPLGTFIGYFFQFQRRSLQNMAFASVDCGEQISYPYTSMQIVVAIRA